MALATPPPKIVALALMTVALSDVPPVSTSSVAGPVTAALSTVPDETRLVPESRRTPLETTCPPAATVPVSLPPGRTITRPPLWTETLAAIPPDETISSPPLPTVVPLAVLLADTTCIPPASTEVLSARPSRCRICLPPLLTMVPFVVATGLAAKL